MSKPTAQAIKNIKAALSDPNHPAFTAYNTVFSTRASVDAVALTNQYQGWMEWLTIAGYVEKSYQPGGLVYTATDKEFQG
jgi:hypothetical protein